MTESFHFFAQAKLDSYKQRMDAGEELVQDIKVGLLQGKSVRSVTINLHAATCSEHGIHSSLPLCIQSLYSPLNYTIFSQN